MTTTASTQSRRPRSEAAALENVIERLRTQFPEMSRDEIITVVTGKHHEFEDASVRDFVPVLVERSVRDKLRGSAQRHRA